MILERIRSSADVKCLTNEDCKVLAKEVRSTLLNTVSKTGGHLASNLGVVELTIAIHRVFDTGKDRLVFDVGHQCYVHKLLTGRREDFATLRQYRGLSGFPKPHESADDAFIAGHASNSVSVALGMARARTLAHEDYHVLALIGDGALTGGLAYEGLNDAGDSGEPMIVILNDNGMSISGNVGGVAGHLRQIRTKESYYNFKRWYRGLFGENADENQLYQSIHAVKSGIKNKLYPTSTLFEDMGFTYLGPVDGHDIEQLTNALRWAKELKTPVLLHVNTVKGKGYGFAEAEPNLYHGVGAFDLRTGVQKKTANDFSAVFGETLSALAKEDKRVCALTAAMKEGTGLKDFARQFPQRFFDVGIAEGHAVSLTGGLAKQGMIPVFAVYSTFLQRGFDELLHDIALLRLHAVFGVDRAGLVGNDGETHHGVFDLAYLSAVPGMTVLAPASFAELRAMLRRAVLDMDGPVALRYPRGGECAYRGDSSDFPFVILKEGKDGVLVSYGTLISEALDAAELLDKKGKHVAVLKLNQLSPLPKGLNEALRRYPRILLAEECMVNGCIAEKLALRMMEQGATPQFCAVNLGAEIPQQGTRAELCRELSLTAEGLAERYLEDCR